MIVVSVASGTSADGLDVGLVRLTLDASGDLEAELLLTRTAPWPDGLRDDLLALLPPASTSAHELCSLDQRVGQAVAAVVTQVVDELAADPDLRPELVVSPGQTVFHDVQDGVCLGTLQLGQPAWIAERTGIPVVSDLRARDVAAGGHGAPLASTLDALWLREPGGPRAALNLGGIANVTVVPEHGPVVAWDTGPANCLIDVAVARVTDGQETFDRDGRLARRGQVDEVLLERLLAHPHYALAPPVSTGREVFSAAYLDETVRALAPHTVGDEDLVATLTELTAVTVARALVAYDVTEVVAAGGGTANPALMDRLRRHLDVTTGATIVTSDERGIPADAKESLMWALLGYLSWHGLPGTTVATGAAHQRILGRFSPGHEPLRLPEPIDAPVRRLRVLQPTVSTGRTIG